MLMLWPVELILSVCYITGFTFNATENTIACDDCRRYSFSKDVPGDLKRGARDAGSFKGDDPTLAQQLLSSLLVHSPHTSMAKAMSVFCKALLS